MASRLEEIASRAEVSAATVSRVLNDRRGVAPATRRRVLVAAEALGHARSASRSVVGIITPELDNPVFGHMSHAIENRLAQHDLLPVVCASTSATASEAAYIEHLLECDLAGLVVLSGSYAEHGADISHYGAVRVKAVPTVLVNGLDGTFGFPAVCVDERAAVRSAVGYLRSLGHERIGCLPGMLRHRSSVMKVEGWSSAAPVGSTDLMVESPYTVEGGHAAAGPLLDPDLGVTAIVCANDLIALGVVRAVRERGLRVPGDISVVGYDGTPLMEFTDPALTTVRQPFERLATAVTRLIVGGPHTDALDVQWFTAELVVRDSTGPVRPRRRSSAGSRAST